jgi:hypothetical protein
VSRSLFAGRANLGCLRAGVTGLLDVKHLIAAPQTIEISCKKAVAWKYRSPPSLVAKEPKSFSWVTPAICLPNS